MKKNLFVALLILSVTTALAQPAGTIMAFGGPKTKIPAGWVLCDGQLLDRTDLRYSRLFNAIGVSWGGDGGNRFAVPDLRGMFLRGVAEGTKTDLEASEREKSRPDLNSSGNGGDAVGSKQKDELREHRHQVSGSVLNCGAGQAYQVLNNTPQPTYTQESHYAGGKETRPKNAYVFYIIKL